MTLVNFEKIFIFERVKTVSLGRWATLGIFLYAGHIGVSFS